MKQLRVRGLHEHVIDEVGRRIVGGEYQPDSPLPSENDLCGSLGVSRTALREALRVLASKGLVEPRRKLGTVVRKRTDWNALDASILTWLLEGADSSRVVDELYELRHLIEPLAASLAAQRAKPEHLQAMRRAFEEMEAAGDSGDRFAIPDLEFHKSIIAASGNRLFAALAPVIGTALAINFDFVRHPPRGHQYLVPAHKKVLDAIANRNATVARVAMQKLIEESQKEADGVRKRTSSRTRAGKRRSIDRAR